MRHNSRQKLTMGVPVTRTAAFRRWFLARGHGRRGHRVLRAPLGHVACSSTPPGMAAQETDTDGDTMPDAWETSSA